LVVECGGGENCSPIAGKFLQIQTALEARRRQRQTLIVPLDNAAEAAVVEGVDVYGAGSLSEVVQFLRGEISLEPVRSSNDWSAAGTDLKLV
jgi:predicted ATPase with chaperone activity